MNVNRRSWFVFVVCFGLLGASPASAQSWLGRHGISPNGNWHVGWEAYGQQRTGLWDRRTQRLVLELKDFGVFGVSAFSAAGTRLAYAGKGDRVTLIEVPSGKPLPAPMVKASRGLAFVNGDTGLVTQDYQRVVLWDLADGKERAAWPLRDRDVVTFSPNGKALAVYQTRDEVVKLLDLGTGKEVPTPKLKGVEHARFQPDGARLVVTTDDPTLKPRALQLVMLDTATGKELVRHQLPWRLTAPALSPDGKTVALTSEFGVELWDVKTLRRERVLTETRGLTLHPLFSPDGRWLAYGVKPGVAAEQWLYVVLRDTATGRERALLNFYDANELKQLQFVSGGKVLLAFNGARSEWHFPSIDNGLWRLFRSGQA